MWLWIACTVGMISALLHPFSKRLQATGLWAGKVLAAEGSESITPTGLQDALTDGWPSSIGLIGILLPFIAGLLGFFHKWWVGIGVFICTIAVSAIMDRMPIAPKSVERYIAIFLGHAARRNADYMAKGDIQRADAAKWLSERLEQLLSIYFGSGVQAPSIDFARTVLHGDLYSLLPGNQKENDI